MLGLPAPDELASLPPVVVVAYVFLAAIVFGGAVLAYLKTRNAEAAKATIGGTEIVAGGFIDMSPMRDVAAELQVIREILEERIRQHDRFEKFLESYNADRLRDVRQFAELATEVRIAREIAAEARRK